MLTNKNYFLNTEITKDDFNQANVLKISDLQTDFQIKIITRWYVFNLIYLVNFYF